MKQAAALGGFEEFVEAMVREAGHRARGLRPETIYFGGGTPSALSTRQLERLLGGLRELGLFDNIREFSMEMNPATLPPGKPEMLREMGVNRASLGVQSWNPRHLATLGRSHSSEAAHRSFQALRSAGFDNLNVDLMFGIPGQSLEDWQRDLERTVGLAPEHISCYSLTYEEDTEFFERRGRGELGTDAALDAAQFGLAQEVLEAAGYLAYETSNFAREEFQCRHNLAIWEGADYLGLGPGAVSTIGGRRMANISDTREYCRRVKAGESPVVREEDISPSARRTELLALGLRVADGVPAEWLGKKTLARVLALGLGQMKQGRLSLTRRGRPVADEIALEAMMEWEAVEG